MADLLLRFVVLALEPCHLLIETPVVTFLDALGSALYRVAVRVVEVFAVTVRALGCVSFRDRLGGLLQLLLSLEEHGIVTATADLSRHGIGFRHADGRDVTRNLDTLFVAELRAMGRRTLTHLASVASRARVRVCEFSGDLSRVLRILYIHEVILA